MTATRDDEIGAIIGLLSMGEMGPVRLRRLMTRHGDGVGALDAIRRGEVADDVDLHRRADLRAAMLADWRRWADEFDPIAAVAAHRSRGVEILDPGHPDWPACFVGDPEPPALLFTLGDRSLFDRVGVAIVGTRRCSAGGAAVARDLGRDLADAGIVVISGLALGVDGAAHRGAVDVGGPTMGVVATGVDVVYPRRHVALWDEVIAAGLLVSESPLGTPATRWRFPARNRLMAAMAELVVVVESGVSGGSMRTVESALDRDTDIAAVPGPVRAPQSAGTNQLLVDGVSVVRDVDDVLAILGTRAPAPSGLGEPSSALGQHGAGDACGSTSAPPVGVTIDPIADLVSWPPISLDRLVAESGLSFGEVASRLAILELDGVVDRVAQGYRRRVR